MADEASTKRESSSSGDEERGVKRPRPSVDMSQTHPKDSLTGLPKAPMARMLPIKTSASSSSSSAAPGPSTASSQSLGTSALGYTRTKAHNNTPRPIFGAEGTVQFKFTPNCANSNHCTNCSPISVVKEVLRFHSPWATRHILAMEKAGKSGIEFPRSRRDHTVMFLNWIYRHRLLAAEERYHDELDPNSVVSMLHGAHLWENARFSNGVRQRVIRHVDNCKTISKVPAGDSAAEDFIRTVCVLKFAALVREGDFVRLAKVFHIVGHDALVSTKVLLDHFKQLPRKMKNGKIRPSVMAWKDELMLPEVE